MGSPNRLRVPLEAREACIFVSSGGKGYYLANLQQFPTQQTLAGRQTGGWNGVLAELGYSSIRKVPPSSDDVSA